jgi:hypothetical protein
MVVLAGNILYYSPELGQTVKNEKRNENVGGFKSRIGTEKCDELDSETPR